jgi:hypothetical protein
VIFNHDVAIAVDARRESDEVADHAIMLDVAIKVGVKVLPNTDVAGQRHERTQHRTGADLHIVHDDNIVGLDLKESHAVLPASGNHALSHAAMADGHGNVSRSGRLCHPLRIGQNLLSVDL